MSTIKEKIDEGLKTGLLVKDRHSWMINHLDEISRAASVDQVYFVTSIRRYVNEPVMQWVTRLGGPHRVTELILLDPTGGVNALATASAIVGYMARRSLTGRLIQAQQLVASPSQAFSRGLDLLGVLGFANMSGPQAWDDGKSIMGEIISYRSRENLITIVCAKDTQEIAAKYGTPFLSSVLGRNLAIPI